MPGSTLESAPAGLRVIADVAEILAAGLVTEDALARVVAVVRRGLSLADARLWLQRFDTPGFRSIPSSQTVAPSLAPLASPDDWVRNGPARERIAGGGVRL